MSALRVLPPGLEGYAALLGKASDDAQARLSHAGQWIPEISPVTGGSSTRSPMNTSLARVESTRCWPK